MIYQFILDVLKILFPTGVGVLGAVFAFLLILLFFPEKIEKWQEIIWGWVDRIGLRHKNANKRKIRHSIQHRVMKFANNIGYNLPDFNPPALKIDWVDEGTDKKAFMENGEAVLRLRRDDPNNDNVATACMLYVSSILLRKTRRFLSPTQKESVELFIGYKILQEDEEAMDVFIDKWLYPGIEKGNEKVSTYFDRYRFIDQSAFFMPIFLQELIYLGEKVFGRKRDDSLIQEVDGALKFLEIYSARIIGERIDQPYFNGNYCRFGIMIIGISSYVDDERYDIYLDHIKRNLIPCGVETIYLIGPNRNRKFMKEIANQVKGIFSITFEKEYKTTINHPNGTSIPSTNYIIVLRNKTIERYVD